MTDAEALIGEFTDRADEAGPPVEETDCGPRWEDGTALPYWVAPDHVGEDGSFR